MHTVCLLQETVDLGSHTISAWTNEDDANTECIRENAAYKEAHPALAYLNPFWVQTIEVTGSEQQLNKTVDIYSKMAYNIRFVIEYFISHQSTLKYSITKFHQSSAFSPGGEAN